MTFQRFYSIGCFGSFMKKTFYMFSLRIYLFRVLYNDKFLYVLYEVQLLYKEDVLRALYLEDLLHVFYGEDYFSVEKSLHKFSI